MEFAAPHAPVESRGLLVPPPPAPGAAAPPGERRSAWRPVRKLPPLHAVALKLMQTASREDVSMREIAALVRQDAAFSAEVLRLANSALFGVRREVNSILLALALLGLQRVCALALTVALRNFLSGVPRSPLLKTCWRHNLACALLAEDIAAESLIELDFAYTAGLLHDVGRLALLANAPEEYSRLVETAVSQQRDLCELETEAFGIDHCLAGAQLAAEWGLPEVFQHVARRHHGQAPERYDVLALIQAACFMANGLGIAVPGRAVEWVPEEVDRRLPPTLRGKYQRDPQQVFEWVTLRINACESSLLA